MRLLTEIRETLLPARGSRHGPLPPLLLAMTVVTGLVDAFSYLILGRVFVANMTGNVVLLGFALAGAPGFSIANSAIAVAFFMLGALAGGSLGTRFAQRRDRLLAAAVALQVCLFAAAAILAVPGGNPVADGYRYALIAVLAVAMGMQNASVRKLAVPDLTTTVLTQTITGIAADSAMAGGQGSSTGRRLLAVAAMLAGALAGAVLVLRVHIAITLVIATVILAAVAATARALGRAAPPWVRGGS
ncbi:MAG TPA: YoaK family protein [Candidatus Dormibacteraeota bacterium]|jgi:uncharacterized membrane protein YoaK (UPF0700 family)|nr:YoaK family protein [Candidatus Dormibacteraeota bacterium]